MGGDDLFQELERSNEIFRGLIKLVVFPRCAKEITVKRLWFYRHVGLVVETLGVVAGGQWRHCGR